MKLRFLKPSAEALTPGSSYVEEMYHGLHFPGFDQMMEDAVQDARTNPKRFEDDMVSIAGISRREAASHVHDLLQQHFDHPGVATLPTNVVAPER